MTKQSRDARFHAFLGDSLGLWRVSATVEAAEGTAAIVRASDGTILWIEEARDESMPFRWLVRWRAAGEAPGAPRENHPRGCASLLGVLSAMRTALNIDRGSPLRVVAAPEHLPA